MFLEYRMFQKYLFSSQSHDRLQEDLTISAVIFFENMTLIKYTIPSIDTGSLWSSSIRCCWLNSPWLNSPYHRSMQVLDGVHRFAVVDLTHIVGWQKVIARKYLRFNFIFWIRLNILRYRKQIVLDWQNFPSMYRITSKNSNFTMKLSVARLPRNAKGKPRTYVFSCVFV